MEVEFRDGKKEVPDHVASLMAGIETWTMTYEQAYIEMNKKLVADQLNRAQDSAIRAHFKEFR